MKILKERTIGEIVAEDYRLAEVFKSFGIDFCCKGNITIDEACEKKAIDRELLWSELEKAGRQTTAATDYKSWPLDLLADYIEKKHHRYVEEKTIIIRQYLEKICTVHGNHHPELFKIKELFISSAGELAMHMKKEELILFPFIRKLVLAEKNHEQPKAPYFGTVQNPVQMMMHEHDVEGERFREIAALSNNYTLPSDGCNTYKVCFALLQEFENDLHLHIHLENNILFPGAIALEKHLK